MRLSILQLQQRRARQVKRLVRKSGKSSLYRKTFPQHLYRYFRDLSNTLINSHWKWTLLTLSLAFILTWLIFACFWAIISLDNADDQTAGGNRTEACLNGIHGFAGYLLFSIETQSTIGYGNRYISHHCPEAIFLMCIQMTVGVCICGYMICIVYLKMIMPDRLHSINCFSKYATIYQRDGMLCLSFRVRDCVSRRYECLTKMSAYLVQKKKEELSLKSIKLEPPGILIWPVEVVHRINETSPFWDLSAKDLIIKRFELIVTMEGISMTTSVLSRTMTSYLSREILWGHKFTPCLAFCKETQAYVINHKLFNKTEEIIAPLCSAKRLDEVCQDFCLLTPYSLSETTTSSPIFNEMKPFKSDANDEDDQFGEHSTNTTTCTAVIHSSPEQDEHDIRIIIQTRNNEILDEDSSYSSADEEELFRIDDENTSTKRGSNLGDGWKLFNVLQKFVMEDNKRAKSQRQYCETSF